MSQEPDFAAKWQGVWKSDWPLTKKHIEADCKLTTEQLEFLLRWTGKMTVQYDGEHCITSMPEIRYTVDGEERVFEKWDRKDRVTVLGRTSRQIAFRMKILDTEYLTVITFEDADTYWVYASHSPFVGLHYREYFRRQLSK